jgi:hypothetical protein
VDQEPTTPPLTVAVVARMLGIAPATLRTWDRRYGLGPSVHAAGAHRKYAPSDVARLEAVHRLVLSGVTPADAARAAVGVPPRAETGRHGGRVLPLPGADEVVRGLGRAAMALDADAVLATVGDQLKERGAVEAWEQVLVPVLVAAGARWAVTGEGVEVEHLLVDCITTALKTHARAQQGSHRPLLLACAPGDLHVLPLHALAAALAERGHGCRVLGASVPAPALAAAIQRTGAAAVFLWAQMDMPSHLALLNGLPVTRPVTAVVVGGPGWPVVLPERVRRADGLGTALDLMTEALPI